MSSHQQQNSTDYGTYRAGEEIQSLRKNRSEGIRGTVDALFGALAQDDRGEILEYCQRLERLLPITQSHIYHVDDVLSASELQWSGEAVLSFITANDREEYIFEADKTALDQLVMDITAMAAVNGDVDVTIQREQPALEYETRVGTRFVKPTSPATGDLKLIETGEEADLKATLLTGSQGSGKSSAVGTLVEDRIEKGHAVIDLVDLFKSENAVYDVEDDHDSAMQDYRVRHGLERGFSGDYEPPDVTVLAPLTHTLAGVEVPFRETDDGGEEPVVTPFTIPASELTFRQLVMLLPHTTKTQQGYIKSAHHYLTQDDSDWSLMELANTVRQKTNAGDQVADRIERSLRTAQSKSFIRDKQSPHVLEWDSLMQRDRHVGAFTVHMIAEKSDKLAVLSYLIDKLHDVRKDLLMNHKLEDTDTYPPLTVVMRELHTVAPRSKSEQDSESTIEGYMIDSLSELLALMRHANMEVIADTQKFKQQLSPDVSGLFHRVFCFSGQKPDVRTVFRTRIDDTDPAEQVAQYDTGECAVVNSDGYKLPIKMAPPRFHHLDASRDGSGLTYRAKQLDDEFLDEPSWSADIPPRLRFEGRFDPREAFWTRFVRVTNDSDDRVLKDRLASLARSWFMANDYQYPGEKQFKTWVKGSKDVDDQRPRTSSLRPEQETWCEQNDCGNRAWVFKGITVEAPPSVNAEHDPVTKRSRS
ncbi:hypothetical protein HTZ84_22560 [Haloterrigena sp. SYSU A558-1]|uniref:Helicase HerA central domain-containing protein n=1 Tax=Haloterrigena gelatinilytica TaxID=2741724 RepID=A0ABX2LMK6_9EURY|nr:DUF87 domain-containing protein [Haloterrigena gelatinilytica]NUC75051.1 hypothetical protein [Haloterrigena gelatinilytica]